MGDASKPEEPLLVPPTLTERGKQVEFRSQTARAVDVRGVVALELVNLTGHDLILRVDWSSSGRLMLLLGGGQ